LTWEPIRITIYLLANPTKQSMTAGKDTMRYLIGFALLLPMVVFAKDPPLPEALLNAKTAFVEKASKAEESFEMDCKTPEADSGATDKEHDKYCKSLKKDAKADKQLFDKFCKELEKWGRFTLVQDRNSADVRILLAKTWHNTVISSTSESLAPAFNTNRDQIRVTTVSLPGGNTGNIVSQEGQSSLIVNGSEVARSERVNSSQSPAMQSVSVAKVVKFEEAIINIRDGRNDVLLYLDQTGGPGKLVSNLKKKMKRK
jgi:hypothetical protein